MLRMRLTIDYATDLCPHKQKHVDFPSERQQLGGGGYKHVHSFIFLKGYIVCSTVKAKTTDAISKLKVEILYHKCL